MHAFVRRWEGTELLVVANLSSEDAEADLDAAGVGDGWAAAELVLGAAGVSHEPGRFVLAPWESGVLRRRARRGG